MIQVDGLQYCRYGPEVFRQLREGRVDAIHVTVAYHEDCAATLANIARWRLHVLDHPQWLMELRDGADIRRAAAQGRTAVMYGFQNCSPVAEDLRHLVLFHALGVRFMQLSYNKRSPLACGCYEAEDDGLSALGREAVALMNRLGVVVDMSHSGERSTLEAMAASERPIALSHANPASFHDTMRNKSDTVLRALAASGGMLGLSLYPLHLRDGSDCTPETFCAMVEHAVERMGVEHVGIGSDLVQGHDDSVLHWMRSGRLAHDPATDGEPLRWPRPLSWFNNCSHFPVIAEGLRRRGFSEHEAGLIAGGNWLRFMEQSFAPGGG